MYEVWNKTLNIHKVYANDDELYNGLEKDMKIFFTEICTIVNQLSKDGWNKSKYITDEIEVIKKP